MRQLLFLIFYLSLAFSCGYALLRGGGPERTVANIFLAATVLSALVLPPLATRFHGLESGVMLVDTVMLFGLVWVAILSTRYWPIWMAALQLLQVFAHVAKLIYQSQVSLLVYLNAVTMLCYPMMALLVIGTYRHQKRLKKIGVDPSW